MSIASRVSAHLAAGGLVEHVPLFPGIGPSRRVLLAAAVQIHLQGPWSSRKDEEQWFQVRANLDSCVQGGLISIAKSPFKAGTALLAQLDPPSDEVWEIRCRAPRPGIRVFGRFAERDTFIAFRWQFRNLMGGRYAHEWHWMIDDCQKDWSALFHPCPPHSGGSPSDYVSANFVLV